MQGYYHSVETFGTVDGNGIRYVLFLSGCRLGCRFCHNPDTWAAGDKMITVGEVLADYNRYRPFYEASGGGLTVSGGEPLLQAGFVASLFAACGREGVHTTLDTAGYADLAAINKVLPYTGAVLFGLKAATDTVSRQLTSTGIEPIRAVLSRVAAAPVALTIRYIVIPGINNSIEEFSALAELVLGLPRQVPVELLPYHAMGSEKWRRLGWEYALADIPAATPEAMAAAGDMLQSLGLKTVC